MKITNPVKKITCSSAENLLEYLSDTNGLWQSSRHFWVFRGLSKVSYELIPCALRSNPAPKLGYSFEPVNCVQKINREQIEAELKKLQEFYWEADAQGLPIPGNPNFLRTPKNWEKIIREINKNGWPIDDFLPLLALAQHYGIATRLLDWSENPFVSAYFAAKDAASINEGKTSFCIWALNLDWIINTAFPGGKVKKLSIYVVTAPRATNPNLHAQAGIFTTEHILPKELDNKVIIESVDKIVTDYCNQNSCSDVVMIQFSVPKTESNKLLRLLNQKRIDAATIYPGYQGYDNEIQVIEFITHYYLNKYSISFYLILYHYSLNMGDFIMIEEPIYCC